MKIEEIEKLERKAQYYEREEERTSIIIPRSRTHDASAYIIPHTDTEIRWFIAV